MNLNVIKSLGKQLTREELSTLNAGYVTISYVCGNGRVGSTRVINFSDTIRRRMDSICDVSGYSISGTGRY